MDVVARLLVRLVMMLEEIGMELEACVLVKTQYFVVIQEFDLCVFMF
jgi:hypothetical protein